MLSASLNKKKIPQRLTLPFVEFYFVMFNLETESDFHGSKISACRYFHFNLFLIFINFSLS